MRCFVTKCKKMHKNIEIYKYFYIIECMTLHKTDPVAIYRALGDEVRLGMVKKIANAGGPVASCTIVSSCSSLLALSQPTVSHHFAKLVSSGVLIEQKQGTQKLYSVDHAALRSAGVDITNITHGQRRKHVKVTNHNGERSTKQRQSQNSRVSKDGY